MLAFAGSYSNAINQRSYPPRSSCAHNCKTAAEHFHLATVGLRPSHASQSASCIQRRGWSLIYFSSLPSILSFPLPPTLIDLRRLSHVLRGVLGNVGNHIAVNRYDSGGYASKESVFREALPSLRLGLSQRARVTLRHLRVQYISPQQY